MNHYEIANKVGYVGVTKIMWGYAAAYWSRPDPSGLICSQFGTYLDGWENNNPKLYDELIARSQVFSIRPLFYILGHSIHKEIYSEKLMYSG